MMPRKPSSHSCWRHAHHQTDLFLVPCVDGLNASRYEAWPFPGLTALETAQSVHAQSPEFKAVIAATALTIGHVAPTESQVLAALPDEWKVSLGRWSHASLTETEAKLRGLEVKHVSHDGHGYHFGYRRTLGDSR